MKQYLGAKAKAKDKVTGYKGIITGVCSYLTGCDQLCIQPLSVNNDYKEARWFDEGRIELIGLGIDPKDVIGEKNGPGEAPTKSVGKI